MTDVDLAHAPHGPVLLADILAQVRRRTPPFLDFVPPPAPVRPGDVVLGHTLSPAVAGTAVGLARDQGLALDQILALVELYDATAPGLMLAVVTASSVSRWYVDGLEVREMRVPAREVRFTSLSSGDAPGASSIVTLTLLGPHGRPRTVHLGTLLDRRDTTILEQAIVRSVSGSGSSVPAAP